MLGVILNDIKIKSVNYFNHHYTVSSNTLIYNSITPQ